MKGESLFARGNRAFQEGDYAEALLSYERFLLNAPEKLHSTVAFNRKITYRRLSAQHGEHASKIIQQIQSQIRLEQEVEVIRSHFDTKFYLAHNPDVSESGEDPVFHYCAQGWREGRDPHQDFSTSFYLETYQDIAEGDINPYWHYIKVGRDEGRKPKPSEDHRAVQLITTVDESIGHIKSAIKVHFDVDYYLAKYPDVKEAGIDPLEHYCQAGWIEKRNPSSDFSTAYYLESNPDVAEARVNPFWHYVVAGRDEGRLSRHPGGYKAEMLSSLSTMEQMSRQWRNHEDPPELLKLEQVAKCFEDQSISSSARLLISIGHDNYQKISGGVQLCIQREEQVANEEGFLYLNVHPWQPLPRLANEADPLVCLILAGKEIGLCDSSTLLQAVRIFADKFANPPHVIVHSLLGHSIEHIQELIAIRKDRHCWFWLHDFFSICPSFALQRNNISFCNAPDLESNACSICVYSKERNLHNQRIQRLFDESEVTVVSPSEVTAKFWLSKANLATEDTVIVPHVDLEWFQRKSPLRFNKEKSISIGFLGAPVHHKGWNIFERLVKELKSEFGIQFIYLGNYKAPLRNVETVKVHVTAEDSSAMTRAITESELDFVLHWATWPETFSFTTFEAIAAGAYVLTNKISGNVAAVVRKTGMGEVFEDENALLTFFKSGAARTMVETVREQRATRYCQAKFSDMTISLCRNKESCQ